MQIDEERVVEFAEDAAFCHGVIDLRVFNDEVLFDGFHRKILARLLEDDEEDLSERALSEQRADFKVRLGDGDFGEAREGDVVFFGVADDRVEPREALVGVGRGDVVRPGRGDDADGVGVALGDVVDGADARGEGEVDGAEELPLAVVAVVEQQEAVDFEVPTLPRLPAPAFLDEPSLGDQRRCHAVSSFPFVKCKNTAARRVRRR